MTTKNKIHDAYNRLLERSKELYHLSNVSELLQWDQEVIMPRGGAAQRAEDVATIEAIIHQKASDPELGALLDTLEAEEKHLDPRQRADIREARRSYERATKVPESLVAALAKQAVLATEHWTEARKQKDYQLFEPHLQETLRLKREYADFLRGERPRYDALLDEYEPGETAANLRTQFATLRPHLVKLLEQIQNASFQTNPTALRGNFPTDLQRQFCVAVLEQMGFNFHEGRLDRSTHPFCSGGGADVRITTRYDESALEGALFGCMHEGGHALYEQGIDRSKLHHPSGMYASLGLHESQSRLWENFIGRSLAFWEHFYPQLQKTFPTPFATLSKEDFWRNINHVTPSLIRTEADEVTYNLHIILRFDFEWMLLEEELSTSDLPEAWNQRYQQDFGITPPDHASGCLQDIHWAAGLIGYFPTYALGNLFAAQIHEKMKKELALDELLSRGELVPIRTWLREHVHAPGRLYPAKELVERVTQTPVSERPFVEYLTSKYTEVYKL